MNFPTSTPVLYWSQREHLSFGLPDVQYATLWIFQTGRFRYINCWPGYAWFSASGTWEERNGQLYCQGDSRGWSDGFADNHANRDYAEVYSPSEDWHMLVSGTSYRSTLTRVSQDAVESCFSGLEEETLPQHWRYFSDLMWNIERELGIRRSASGTFLIQDPA